MSEGGCLARAPYSHRGGVGQPLKLRSEPYMGENLPEKPPWREERNMGFQFEHRVRGTLCASLLILAAAATARAGTHTVTAGDSLWGLAKQYGVSVEAIQKANGLDGEKIRRGQTLSIPAKGGTPKKTAQKSSKGPALTSSKSGVPPRAGKSPPPKPPPASYAPVKTTAGKTQSAIARTSPTAPSPAAVEAAEELYSSERTVPPSTLEEIAPAWVLERPGPETQREKSNAARGGIYPCVAPDPGFGSYEKWVQVAPMAHVLPPSKVRLDSARRFDVVFHFHGREPIRKEWVKSMDDVVLVAVDVGIDSGAYATAFSDPRTFGSVLRAVEAEISKRTGGDGARVGRVALSSWSAGFGAVEKILAQPLGEQLVDSVILLDGLHSGYTGHSLDGERLRPFVKLAKAATRGDKLFFVSHSSILTTGYASTTETAQYLVWRVGGRPDSAEPLRADPMGLERRSVFSRGDFHVRGFKGSGASDHCAHLGLMRDVLRVHLEPRWRRGGAPSSAQPEALALRQAAKDDQ